ncbi:MAG TPA: hypothetical protein VN804_03705, partial [Solirubrobacteraceae bacterium]|nr:hypothetical protein [Solirubrobacteraceae bacterium]
RLPAGRGFTQDNAEFQIAVPTLDGAVATLHSATASLAQHRARAPRIEVLSSNVALTSLARDQASTGVPIGVRDDELLTAYVDLSERHLIVIGPYRSGRTTTLATLLEGLRERDADAQLFLLSPRRNALSERVDWSGKASGTEACAELVAEVLARHEQGSFEEQSAFLIVDDGGELADARVLTQLERLVRAGRDSALRVIAAVETGSARGLGNSWIRELRREGHGVLLQPDLSADGDLLSVRLPRRVAAPLTPGRGFLVAAGAAELIQVAREDPDIGRGSDIGEC